MAETPVIDPVTIENLRALSDGESGDFLKEIGDMFLADTPLRIAELDQSLASGETPKFTRAAHSIKGSSANIGATHLQAAAAQLEHDSRHNPISTLVPQLDKVKSEFARVKVELEKLIA